MILDVLLMWSGFLYPFMACALVCTVIELLPRPDIRLLPTRVRGVIFWSIFLFGSALGLVGAQQALIASGISPLIDLDLSEVSSDFYWPARILLVAGLALLPAFIFDFAYYWFHRLQHAVPFLWRFHAVHHAIEDLNGTNCYHHWSEGLIRAILIVIPLTILIRLQVPEVLIVSILAGMWGQAVHLKTNLRFGPADRILVSPTFHRVHHSLEARHYDKNFAGIFSIFDVAFGTAYFPAKREKIETGLSDKREARTLGQYLLSLQDRR